jgi:hypothetical protein
MIALQIRCGSIAYVHTENKCLTYAFLLLKFVSLINVADSAFSMGFSVWVEMGTASRARKSSSIMAPGGKTAICCRCHPLPAMSGASASSECET